MPEHHARLRYVAGSRHVPAIRMPPSIRHAHAPGMHARLRDIKEALVRPGRRLCTVIAAATLFVAYQAVYAEPLWPLEQRFNLSLGAFLFDSDTRIRVDGSDNTLGTEIDFDRSFGFPDQDRFRVDGYWRLAQRHKLRFMYFGSRADSRRNISEQIRFRDVTFPIDAQVRAEFDTDVIELVYEYAFLRRDTFELAASAGLHNLRIEARVSAALASGQADLDRRAEAKGNGPLPVIGLHAVWAFSDGLYLDAQAQFFAIELDEYDGSLQDYKLNLVWMPGRHLGLGIGYNDFTTRLDVDGDDFMGRLKFAYGGPIAFVAVAF